MHPLAHYRAERGLTQEALAAQLGVKTNTVSRWEAGVRKIKFTKVAHVSGLTGIPVIVLRPDLAPLLQAPESLEALSVTIVKGSE